MRKNLIITYSFILFPALIFITVATIAWYAPVDNQLALGLTLDLTLTAPLVYWLLIRSSTIPKTTVVPVFILGILLGTLILPVEQQDYLNWIKTWCVPVVEGIVLSYIVYQLYRVRTLYQKQDNADFYMQTLEVVQELFPKKISYFMASELVVPYYCLGRGKDKPLAKNQFYYHQKSGSVALLWALVMIIIVELIGLHFLIGLFSEVAAWCLTILSAYTCAQIIALIRSLKKRPIEVTDEVLWLKYGTCANAPIALNQIDDLEFYQSGTLPKEVVYLSPLGEMERPNLILRLKEAVSIHLIFGKEVLACKIAFYVDEPQELYERLEKKLKIYKDYK